MNPSLRAAAIVRRGLLDSFEARLGAAVLATALAVFAATPAPAHEAKAGDIVVEHPWARATPGGAKVAGAFAVIENAGGAPDRLVGGSAEVAGRVEIHEMAVKDGVMTMRPVAGGLEVPAHGGVTLKPGSYHLMLMELKEPLVAGGKFAGTLVFEKAGTVPVTFEIAPIGAKDAGHAAGQ